MNRIIKEKWTFQEAWDSPSSMPSCICLFERANVSIDYNPDNKPTKEVVTTKLAEKAQKPSKKRPVIKGL
jgi:hypothetical protein